MKAIGIFGGAFAPFHNGHLRVAIECRERLDLSIVHLIPTANPAHRTVARVSAQRRLEWLRLALRKEKGFVADDREILRQGTTFTFDTLTELRAQYPQASLVLIMGADAFAHLHTWHRWKELLNLAHLVVIARKGAKLDASVECASTLEGLRTTDPDALHNAPAGLWMQLDLPLLDISSTRIRRLLKKKQSVRGLLPDAILNHITAADIAVLTQDEDATTH